MAPSLLSICGDGPDAELIRCPVALQRIRYIDLETIGGIGRVGSQIRCRSIRLPPTKPVYAQRRIRSVRDQGDAAGRGWAVSVSNQESTRVARARRKRERVEQGVTHRDFALV